MKRPPTPAQIADAKAECERWFAYLDRSRKKAEDMGRIASDRRKGLIDTAEAQRRVRALDSGVTVFDGARLEKAVRLLLTVVP